MMRETSPRSTESQTARIIDFLKTGKPLTPLVALDKFGCFRLAARIKEIRECGEKVNTHIIRIGSKRVASYRLVI